MTHTEEIAIEELVKKYIRENLTIKVALDKSFGARDLEVSLLLNGETISESYVQLDIPDTVYST